MFQTKNGALALAVCMGLHVGPALAADDADLQKIRDEIGRMKQSYEQRIAELERRLQKAETAQSAPSAPSATSGSAVEVAAGSGSAPASAGAFNPGISLILSGGYSRLSQDPDHYRITGFVPGGDIGPGPRGFNLGESELGVYASIDPWFYGGMALALDADNSVSVEEAFVQTTALPHGLKLKAGRFFSGIGYLNEQHAHTWDFVDSPLVYQAFLGSQFSNDGLQLKWLLPTETFVELGAEAGRGSRFPGNDKNSNGAGALALHAHAGGDIGASHSWRGGVSYLHASPRDRADDDENIFGQSVENSFSGRSDLWIADFVWKWAPNGNGERTNFKLQGEYFHRNEKGDLVYDAAHTAQAGDYSSRQSGWYLQGVYQFMPAWRIGLRYDQLYGGSADYGANGAYLDSPGYNPNKSSVMIDWTPSEFSRIRLQYAQDKSRQGLTDNQVFLQYQMSLGSHGAHSF